MMKHIKNYKVFESSSEINEFIEALDISLVEIEIIIRRKK